MVVNDFAVVRGFAKGSAVREYPREIQIEVEVEVDVEREDVGYLLQDADRWRSHPNDISRLIRV